MTNQPESQSLGDQLVAMEKKTPALVEAYRRDMSALTEQRWSAPQRWLAVATAVYLGAFLIALWRDRQEKLFASDLLSQLTLVAWVGGIVMIVGLFALAARGRCSRRLVNQVCLALTVAVVGGQGLLMLNTAFSAADPIVRRQLTFSGEALLLVTAAWIAGTLIQEMYHRLMERLLRIELRLAVAAEPASKPANDADNRTA